MKLRSRTNCASSGFSTAEAMIGIVMIAIAVQAIVPLIISSSHLSSHVVMNHNARVAALQKLDEIRASNFDVLQSNYDGHAFDVDVDGDGTVDLRPPTGTSNVGGVVIRQVPGGALGGEALQAQITLEWLTAQGTRSYRLTTTIARS